MAILVAGGVTEKKNGQVAQHKTTAKVAAACEMSTRRGATARLLPSAFRTGRMSNPYYPRLLEAGQDRGFSRLDAIPVN